MIRVENGRMEARGSVPELCSDLSTVVSGLNDLIAEGIGTEGSHEMIMKAVELGLKSEDEIRAEAQKVIDDFMDSLKAKLTKMFEGGM